MDEAIQSSHRVFIPIGFLYALYGLILGFVQGGAGPVLISRGLPLEYAGFAGLLFLPFGLAFLWAPVIERRKLPGFPSETGWIVACLLIASILFACLAAVETSAAIVWLAIGVAITASLATMDLQLEGLVVRLVPETQRPVAAALKIGTFSLGAVLGGGVLVGFFEALGWSSVFVGFAIISVLPLLTLQQLPQPSTAVESARVSVRRLAKSPGFLPRLGALALFLASCFLLFGLNRVALVDLGASLQDVGWIVGTLGPLISLPVIAIAAQAVRRFGPSKVLTAFLILGAISGLGWRVLAGEGTLAAAFGVTIAGTMILAGTYVVFLGAILKWSSGDMPATTYAVFYGLANLAALVPMAGAGALANAMGWSVYYALATLAFVATGALFRAFVK